MTAAQEHAQPIDATFASVIEKNGAFPTYLELPGSAEVLGTRRAVKVTGTLDGHRSPPPSCPRGRARTGSR